MDRTERFYKIEQLLISRRVVPISDFLDELEVSPATFKRDLEYLRDRMNMPTSGIEMPVDIAIHRTNPMAGHLRCRGCGSMPLKCMPS